MSKRGIGYAVFGNPKGFETKGVGLFNQVQELVSELYLGSSEFSLPPGEVFDGLIGIQVPEIGPMCIWGRWAGAKGIDSERSGGWRGAAVVVAGSQPNWESAARNLDELFRQIGAQCDADGHFKTGKEEWQIRFPELLESDLTTVPLETMDGQSAQVAVALHASHDLIRAVELGMNSLGRGVPRRWFFATPKAIEYAKRNGAGFKAVLGFPDLMAHFLDSMGQKKNALKSKMSEVQQNEAKIQDHRAQLRKKEEGLEAEKRGLQERESKLHEAEDQWNSKLKEKEVQLQSLVQQIAGARQELDGLKKQGAPARNQLKKAEDEGREKGYQEGQNDMDALWMGRARVAGMIALSLMLTAVVLGVYAFFFRNPEKPAPLAGCTYENAYNYDFNAQVDNGTCLFDQPEPGEKPVEESGENEDANAAKNLREIIGVLSDHDSAFDQASDEEKDDILKRRSKKIRDLSSYVNLKIKPQIGLLFRVLSEDRLKDLQWEKLSFKNEEIQKELEKNDLKVEWNAMVEDLNRSPGFQSKMKLSEVKKEAFPDDPDVNSWPTYKKRILIALKAPLETTGLPEKGNWRWRYLEGWNYNDVDSVEVEKRGWGKGMSAFAFRDFQKD